MKKFHRHDYTILYNQATLYVVCCNGRLIYIKFKGSKFTFDYILDNGDIIFTPSYKSFMHNYKFPKGKLIINIDIFLQINCSIIL